jgi:transcriptional regulator with GAF, ATPase, and Fis domain
MFFVRSDLPTTPSDTKDLDSSELLSEPPGFATLLPHAHPSLAGLARVATSKLPLLLLGETGTGKEVLAKSVHALSGREGPFMAVNCGALPPNLVESHLFGHVKGAFSGALRDEPGAIRAAQLGTLLFDEVGDLPRAAQPALLRFLQEGEITPVGSARPVRVDVRVVAATHRPLGELVESGDFRADLLARLSGFVHALAPLCDRREDIGLIIARILAKHDLHSPSLAMAPAAGRRLLSHTWPANVRELEHAIVRGFTLAEGDRLEDRHLLLDDAAPSLPQRGARPSKSGSMRPLSEADAQLRRDLVAELQRCNGNIADVARALGKARMQIHRWIKRLDIDPTLFRR